jgi:hypothetical protein
MRASMRAWNVWRSVSVSPARRPHSIRGGIGRETPKCRPVQVSMNIFSVQIPPFIEILTPLDSRVVRNNGLLEG